MRGVSRRREKNWTSLGRVWVESGSGSAGLLPGGRARLFSGEQARVSIAYAEHGM